MCVHLRPQGGEAHLGRGRPGARQAAVLEVHNPTDKEIKTILKSPPNTPLFGKFTADVTVPAGDSLWLALRDGKLVPRE